MSKGRVEASSDAVIEIWFVPDRRMERIIGR